MVVDGSDEIGPVSDGTPGADRAAEWRIGAVWVAYALIFLAIPFAVVALRLHMQAWHYYLAGGLFLGGALLICALDLVAEARRHGQSGVAVP